MKFPVIAILGLAICTAVAQDTAAILDKLRKEQQTVSLQPAQLLKQYTATQKPDGSWEDIDYRDRNHSLWAAAAHIRRTLHLAQAWAKPGQPMFHDETVGRTVRRAVDYWSRHRFQCGNWWWNEIGIPERMANILIAAPELFHDSEERRNALAVVRQTAFGKTGQNRVWQAEIVLKRALLEQDEPTARHAVAEITSELQVRNGEGIQEDGSFHQHGRQLQLGNYGLGFLQSMSYWNRILAGTPLAFPPERTEALRHLVLNGYRWVIWNGPTCSPRGGRSGATPRPEKQRRHCAQSPFSKKRIRNPAGCTRKSCGRKRRSPETVTFSIPTTWYTAAPHGTLRYG